MRISFLGDICFNGIYEELYKNKEKPFSKLSFLKKSDFVVANLECFAESSGTNKLKSPILKTDIETYNWLSDINITHVGLANNHAYDNLLAGFEKSLNKLKELDIKFSGASLTNEINNYFDIEKDGVKIRVLNFVDKDTNPNLPNDCPVYLSFFKIEELLSQIKFHKKECNHLILYVHWGGRSENLIYPAKKQIIQSEKLIKEGIDLIIGHHSHTIQPRITINQKKVFFSLGNFCFSDIILSDNTYYTLNKRNREGLVLTVDFYEDQFRIAEENIVQQDITGHLYINNDLKKAYEKEYKFFNFIIKFSKNFSNIPIFYDKFIRYPIFFFRKNDIKKQLKKISYSKIINYLKR